MSSTSADARSEGSSGKGLKYLRDISLLSVSHTIHDGYLVTIGVLVPMFIERLGLSFTLVGLLSTIQHIPYLAQPFFGYVADRANTRMIFIVTSVLTGVAIGLAPNSSSYWMLAVLVFLAGMCSSAFHPAGGTLVSQVGGERRGAAMALYYFGGNLGRSLGPLAMVWLITAFGVQWSYLAAIPGVLMGLLLWRFFPHLPQVRTSKESFGLVMLQQSKILRPLFMLFLCKSISTGGLTLFLPTFMMQRGMTYLEAGFVTTAFFFFGGIGGIVTGYLSDWFGRKAVLLWSFILTPVAMVGFLLLGTGWFSLALLMFAGAVLMGEQPIIIALVQELSPTQPGATVGLALGIQFVLHALAGLAVGVMGDRLGLGITFQILAIAPIFAVPGIMALKIKPKTEA